MLTDHEKEIFEERAAIRQHDAGQTRAEAERGAMEDIKRIRENKHDTDI